MILLFDIGNTRIKWAWWREGRLSDLGDAWHRDRVLRDVLDEHAIGWAAPQQIFVANVAGEAIARDVVKWANDRWCHVPRVLSAWPEALGLRNAYTQPQRLGVDRWLAMLGARRYHSGPIIVAVCGTALTIDTVDSAGHHEGGLIVPGAHAMAQALVGATHLPAFSMDGDVVSALAHNTQDGMVSGIWHALAGAIERVYDDRARVWRCEPRLFLSGGDGDRLAAVLHRPAARVPHLVLEGLACLVPILSSSG